MWLKAVQLRNTKAFENSGVIEFSKEINLLVGANSAGKSTVLRAINLLQPPTGHNPLPDFFKNGIRIGAIKAELSFALSDLDERQIKLPEGFLLSNMKPMVHISGDLGPSLRLTVPRIDIPQSIQFPTSWSFFKQTEPDNFIYPYYSHRKPSGFQLQINSSNANSIEETFTNLPSKIDRLLSIDSDVAAAFREDCEKILQLKISCMQYENGKHVGIILQNRQLLPIGQMGEGVSHALAFLAHLYSASGNLFLIEEIENDLHPKALKHLLDIIISKSANNQFIISTHSNIVVKHLGSVPTTRIFSIQMELNETTKIPTASCKLLSDAPEERIQLLENLGYEPADFYLWKAYLILEESSAEYIIKTFLIPYLVPKLQGKLQTIAAQGVDDVEARFTDFLRIFVFIHTSPQYRNRAWVAVDNGAQGEKVVASLQAKFVKDWPSKHFRCFKAEDFERYYPPQFHETVAKVLGMTKGKTRRDAKKELALEVLDWATANIEVAKSEFEKCAAEILGLLREIETEIR